MKRLIILTSIILMMFTPMASASVGSVSITTHKNGSYVTAYVKNNDNKVSQSVYLELQKDGRVVSSKSLTVKKNEQVKTSFSLSSKGTYTIKYTVKNKSDYTAKFNK